MTPIQQELLVMLARPRTREELCAVLDEFNGPAAFRMHMVRLRRVIRPMGLSVQYTAGVYTLMRRIADAEDRSL
jgi:hypothetical protein